MFNLIIRFRYSLVNHGRKFELLTRCLFICLFCFDQEELEIILNWAINQGLPNDTNSGFWTAWKRDLAAPAEPNGTVTKTNQDIRKDRELFKLPWRRSGGRPVDSIWRNETQPGNTLDQRDEMCTAQSRPGKQPEFLGIDDYECNGTTLHYIVCQVPMVNDDYE